MYGVYIHYIVPGPVFIRPRTIKLRDGVGIIVTTLTDTEPESPKDDQHLSQAQIMEHMRIMTTLGRKPESKICKS